MWLIRVRKSLPFAEIISKKETALSSRFYSNAFKRKYFSTADFIWLNDYLSHHASKCSIEKGEELPMKHNIYGSYVPALAVASDFTRLYGLRRISLERLS